MPLTSIWFRGNQKLQFCLVSDPQHVQLGAKGDHVRLIHGALVMLDRAILEKGETSAMQYGPSTARAVKAYKTQRAIINTAYQTKPDDVVGKMTIRRMDEEMLALERGNGSFILVSTGAPRRHGVVSAPQQPWAQWARQFVATDTASRFVHMMPGHDRMIAVIKHAISSAGAGGTIAISVGHGGAGDGMTGTEGFFDLAPAGSFRVAGANAYLVGDERSGPWPTARPAATSAYYDWRPNNPVLRGGLGNSRKMDDEASGSVQARRRLANWNDYLEICKAFKGGGLAFVVLVACNVGQSAELLRRVASQWNTPVVAYSRKVAAGMTSDSAGRIRLFLLGDAPGQGTNIPLVV
jgi:hypothetical protein